MRRLLVLVAASLAAACTPLLDLEPAGAVVAEVASVSQRGDSVAVVTKIGETVEISGLRALIVAEEWYQFANRAALAVVKTGVLPDTVLRQIRSLNSKIIAALERGKRTADGAERASAAAEAMSAVLDLRKLVGAK